MKNRSLYAFASVGVLVSASLTFAQTKQTSGRDEAVSVMPEVATEGLTAAQSRQLQENVAHWLAAETPAGLQSVRVQIDPAELNAIENPEVVNAAPLKVGVVIPMQQAIRLQGLDGSRDLMIGGQLSRTRDGGLVWAATVGSDGAGGVRLHIEDMLLPDNASLYFFSENGESYGPYTGTGPDSTGEFWTPSVIGEEGTLQLRIEPGATKAELASVALKVTEVGHISRSFFGIADEGAVSSFCQFNAPCIENNNCTSDPAVNDAESAVAKMLWVSGCCLYTCSGGLIADSDAGTQIPYFITAGHCLSKSSSSLEAFFRYTVPCGTSTCTATFTDPPNNLIAGKTVGATLLARGSISAGDYCLLQLSQTPPAGSVFLGWTTAAVSGSNGTALYRVSHPSGAPQAFSSATVDTTAGTCTGWPRGPLIYSRGNVGATEGGSSGSPVVNSSGQVVGTLTGGCGTNLNDECDHASNATVDGAFAYYYSAISQWLAGGGGGCGAAGTSCTSGSQCCSGSCRRGSCR